MADIISKQTRSQMMAGIKNKDTIPELLVRKELFKQGLRYRLHNKKLPGNPDIILTRYHAVIFVHGCFWHGHECFLFKWPNTRTEFWKDKISKNVVRDKNNIILLNQAGWRTLVIWECALKGKYRIDIHSLAARAISWLQHEEMTFEIRGRDDF
jgi:DNA mismatch endonuclease (patch repair protein)